MYVLDDLLQTSGPTTPPCGARLAPAHAAPLLLSVSADNRLMVRPVVAVENTPPGASEHVHHTRQKLPITPALASAMLILAAFCWGSGNVANKTVLTHLDPVTVVGLRCLLAALVVAPFALREWRSDSRPGWWANAFGVSALLAVALLLQQIAYQSTSVTNASFLVNTATVMTPLLAWLVFRQRPGWRIVCAVPITLAGALMMAGGVGSLTAPNPGDLLCLGSALAYAAWVVALGHHAIRHGRPFLTSLMQFGLTSLVTLPAGILLAAPTLGAVADALPELMMLGVVSTGFAFTLQTYAQRFVAASTATILVSAESIFGAAGAWLVLNEQIPLTGLIGAALILAAIVIVALGEHRQAAADRPVAREHSGAEPFRAASNASANDA